MMKRSDQRLDLKWCNGQQVSLILPSPSVTNLEANQTFAVPDSQNRRLHVSSFTGNFASSFQNEDIELKYGCTSTSISTLS